MHMSDNAGATDEHSAVNCLAMRYLAIYAQRLRICRGKSFPDRGGGASFAHEQQAPYGRCHSLTETGGMK
jgi:hypothetical protein